MSTLSSMVIQGKVPQNDFLLIHGPDKVGKTTFSASAPKAIIVGPEGGAGNIDVAKLPVTTSVEELRSQLLLLRDEKHDFKTVVIDSLDHLEPLIWASVVKADGVQTIEQVGGGFGKGYVASLRIWDSFFQMCAQLREKMNVHFIAHSHVKVFNDPQTGSAYDRYVLKMHDKASALCREKVDTILFANYKTFTKGKEGQKHKAFGDGTRVMYTERRPAFDAGNRFGLPFELPLSYAAYESAKKMDRSEEIKKEISELRLHFTPEQQGIIDQAIIRAEVSAQNLVVLRDELKQKLSEKGES